MSVSAGRIRGSCEDTTEQCIYMQVLAVDVVAVVGCQNDDACPHAGRAYDHELAENSLAAQISTLRKAFGADRELIQTVAGRGYQFTGEIRKTGTAESLRRPGNLPEPLSELIGRETAMAPWPPR